MNTRSDLPSTETQPSAVARILQTAGAVAIFPVLMAFLLFLASDRLDWTWAWVYVGLHLAHVLIAGPSAIRAPPEPAAESGEGKTTETRDQLVSVFYLLAMYVALPVVAGLHVRFGWARDLGLAWHLAGAAVLALGLAIAAWAMLTNAYMWSSAPVQPGQTVCSGGPYRFVRHPAYLGLVLQALGVPILLGSCWALIPGITAAACMIIGTSSEDRLLQAELPGYRDYVEQIPFRLVPGVW